MKRAILLMTMLAMAGCGGSTTSASSLPPTSVGVFTTTEMVVGTGATAANGNTVTVSYVGYLYDTGKPFGRGTQFDAGTIAPFVLGAGNLIQGFQQGIVGMKVGGQRRVIIPPELGYGSGTPDGSRIPANATLVFEITLTALQ